MNNDLAGDAIEAIERDGFTIVPDVIDDGLRLELCETIDRLMVELDVDYGPNTFLGTRTRRIFNLLSRDPVFAELPLLPGLLSLAEQVLDPECLLSSLTAIELNPGETLQPVHADDGSITLPRPHPALTCTALVALSDFTLENGATRVVPGSHRFDRIPRKGDDPDTVHAVMPAGSAVMYHGSVWHGGGANTDTEPRLAIVVNYCAGFVRQEEAQLLAVPAEIVATFPSRLQQLCGYSTYRGLIGHVDQQDPRTMLDSEATTDMVWGRIGS